MLKVAQHETAAVRCVNSLIVHTEDVLTVDCDGFSSPDIQSISLEALKLQKVGSFILSVTVVRLNPCSRSPKACRGSTKEET